MTRKRAVPVTQAPAHELEVLLRLDDEGNFYSRQDNQPVRYRIVVCFNLDRPVIDPFYADRVNRSPAGNQPRHIAGKQTQNGGAQQRRGSEKAFFPANRHTHHPTSQKAPKPNRVIFYIIPHFSGKTRFADDRRSGSRARAVRRRCEGRAAIKPFLRLSWL